MGKAWMCRYQHQPSWACSEQAGVSGVLGGRGEGVRAGFLVPSFQLQKPHHRMVVWPAEVLSVREILIWCSLPDRAAAA